MAAAGANDPIGRTNLEKAKIACGELDQLTAARTELLKGFKLGALGETQQSLREAEDRLVGDRAQAQDRQTELDRAAKAYQDALAAADGGTSSKEALAAAADRLSRAVQAIQDLQTPFGDVVLSKERIDQVNAVLDNLKDGKELGADATKAQIVITTIPTLADDVRAIRNADKKASLVPLLMWRDMEQGRLRAASVQVAMVETDVALLQATVEAQLAEAQALSRSRRELSGAGKPFGSATPLHKTWDATKDTASRVALYSALDAYLDAIGRLRQTTERLRRTRYALSLEKSAALSEVNAGIWTSLIGASVNQAAEYSASGVSAANLANFITALGVLGIAHGTNK